MRVRAVCLTVLLVGLGMAWAGGAPAEASPRTRAVAINFDDVVAPCGFSDTHALRTLYGSLGVHFQATAPANGGGILNECSNFGVSGYSSPNFLAFNPGTSFGNGGVPHPPEKVTFDTPMTHVQFSAGTGIATVGIKVLAYDPAGHFVTSSELVLRAAVQVISVDAPEISFIIIRANCFP